MATVTITQEIEVPEQLPYDIFTTALYGGINYWATTLEFRDEDPSDFYAIVVDSEEYEDDSDDCVKYRINHDSIVKGLRLTAESPFTARSSQVLAALVDYENADFDASDADDIVQMGLFGELVYG